MTEDPKANIYSKHTNLNQRDDQHDYIRYSSFLVVYISIIFYIKTCLLKEELQLINNLMIPLLSVK